MILGIVIMVLGLIALLVFVSRDEDDELAVLGNLDLDLAEQKLEMQGVKPDASPSSAQELSRNLVRAALLGSLPGFGAGLIQTLASGSGDWYQGIGYSALTSTARRSSPPLRSGQDRAESPAKLDLGLDGSCLHGGSQSVGFASNSYTIWEDSILLFFTTTFGFASALSSLSLESRADRYMGIYHSVLFVVLGRLASFSKLCREEQMPYCTSTYYASTASSTSAPWQLVIPFLVVVILPDIIKAYLVPTKSCEGLAPTWIGYVFRVGLLLSALYWTLDTADNGAGYPDCPTIFSRTSAYIPLKQSSASLPRRRHHRLHLGASVRVNQDPEGDFRPGTGYSAWLVATPTGLATFFCL